jgi:hypothetical protein
MTTVARRRTARTAHASVAGDDVERGVTTSIA